MSMLAGHPRYELRGELGSGSFGVVYRVYDRERGCEVALKWIRDFHPRALNDLRSELRARAEVHHPNLLQLYELEVERSHAFLTMELVADAVTFVEHVRGGVEPPRSPLAPESLVRLVRATHGLISALHRLHAAGFVHRDVKPQNVLVHARTGELRLADFGLATPWTAIGAKSHWGYLYGTPAYIAPELWWGAGATPASDLYSAGVMLLEALTGERPDGASSTPVAVPSWLGNGLVELISGLLAREPQARLDASAVSARLCALAPELRLARLAPLVGSSFVGRAEERARVLSMLQRSAGAMVWIRGPSGIGKTSFVDHVLARWTGVAEGVVLRGRCHPQEHVSFPAWDEVAGQLAGHFGRERVERALSPDEVTALQRLFPVFEVDSPDQWPDPATPDADLRRLATNAFRTLLRTISAARRLVIWLDDLQWANDDSLALLGDLLQRGVDGAVWILSHREDDEGGASELRARLASTAVSAEALDLRLGALERSDVAALLGDLGLGEVETDTKTLELLAALPMFAPELAASRNDVEGRPVASERPLATLVERRLAGLDERQIRVLDTVAASPRPIPWSLLAGAVERPADLFDDFLALRQAGLLRRTETGAGARVWTFHDLIREARVSSVPATVASDLHRDLIRAYDEHASGEHEALAYHLEQIGDHARASRSLVQAGAQAFDRLAFASAASHLDRACTLDAALNDSWALQTRRAECDANRGRARAAGERFERAARLREVAEGPTATLGLRSRAARELICCGQIGSGYEILRQLMRRLGTRLPGNHLGTLAWSAALRGRLILREPDRRASPAPPETQACLDALWTGCTSLSHINHALADVFLLRHLTLALQVGDEAHLTKSLTFEAVAEGTIGGAFLLRRGERLMARARAICERRDDDYDWAWYWTSRAAWAAFDGDWPGTVEHSLRAEPYYDRRRFGVAWERSVVRVYRAIALAMLGDVPALRAVVRATAADAREREDPVALNGISSGHPAILRLYDDAPRESDLAADHGGLQRGTRWPEAAFTSPDYYDLIAEAERLLYEDRAREALARVDRDWKALGESALLRLRFVGIDARYLRARCALYAAGRPGCVDRERRGLIAVATDEMRRVRRSGERLAEAYARALAAGLAGLAGERAGAAADYAGAASAFMACGMQAHAAAADRGAAWARGDAEGIARADGRLAALGAVRPARLACVLVPTPGLSPTS